MAHPSIILAEEKYRKLLSEECRRIFSGTDMPSHDHLHHERVWENAAILLERFYNGGFSGVCMLAERAVIAVFFHDTGLTVNRGTDHGLESRNICSAFLAGTDIPEADRREILDAVEMHDNKDYPGNSDPSSLAAVVSVADDMDAFGEAGIERYMEIYSMRGVTAEEMSALIVPNVLSRFRHLESTYFMFPDLVEEMRVRADTVINYFTQKAR